MANKDTAAKPKVDVVLIGAGIMSATLGVLLKELQPDLTIEIIERLDEAAAESSDAWNNAGTGHSAFCELNYTPELEDGTVEITKAVKIAESFEVSKQFWAYLIENKLIQVPEKFIAAIPHMSFVWGDKNVNYLKKRYEALTSCHLFDGMEYSENPTQLQQWMPLVMEGRKTNDKVAATRMDLGTDVNFGALTRCMFHHLSTLDGVTMHFGQEVRDLRQKEDKIWRLKVKDLDTDEKRIIRAKFVFIGAGGGSLRLLEKSDIPEGRGFGGFPVGGQWLVCNNPEVIEKHHAKVYGTAGLGAPPMSVPHLDTRIINGKKSLFFGPYAGFSTKFLKHGSYFDLPLSIKPGNIIPLTTAGIKNLPLTKYLLDQVRLTPDERLDALQEYLPTAKLEDWELKMAGQRVQVIKNDPGKGGVLQFGTEVVSKADGSLAALLGASPGASTAVSIMLDVLSRCYKTEFKSEAWQAKLKQMIPSFGKSMGEDAQLCHDIRTWTSKVLGLEMPEPVNKNADS